MCRGNEKKLKIRKEFLFLSTDYGQKIFLTAHFIPHGDRLHQTIAAASIIAKVARDQMMTALSEQYPQYGFERHVGYGTRAHYEALLKYGPCPIHRRSFAPIKKILAAREAEANSYEHHNNESVIK